MQHGPMQHGATQVYNALHHPLLEGSYSNLIGSLAGAQVYNTGRSLGQFVSLVDEKAGGLALPNVLITAVGTKARPIS